MNPTTQDLLTILRANPHPEQRYVWIGDVQDRLIFSTKNVVINYDGEQWFWFYCDGYNPPTQDRAEPTQFKSLDPKDVHAEIDRVLNIAKQTHTETQTMTKNPTPEDILANLKANPHPKQTHLEMAGGFAYITIDTHKIAYDGERWFVCGQQITPQFPMNSLHQEIDRVFVLARKIKDHVLKTDTKEQTTMTEETDFSGNHVFRSLYDHPYTTMKYLRISLDGVCRFFLNGKTWRFDDDVWEVGDEKIEHNLPVAEKVTAEMLHDEIRRVSALLDKTTTPTWEETKADCVGPDLPTEQTFVSADRYRELEAELAKVTTERDELSVRVKQKTDVIVAQAAQIQQHSDGWEQTEAQLEAMTASCDELQKKVDSTNSQMSDLLAERERLFAQNKTLTEERDGNESSYNYAQNLLNQVWDATGWLEKADNEPCGIEYLRRLKSKADRAGLLSVVCRRLCGDENASIETVHKALDRVDDRFNALDNIAVNVGADPDILAEIQANVAQAVKLLGEKTVEVAKLQEGLTNYKAHVEGLTKRVEQMTFERDAERVGNKWLSETIEDLKRTTVKLPGEHTLRRLFNRHNTPDKYDDGTPIPTLERFLLTIENLCRNAECLERRFEELNAISTRVDTESEDAHATLDEMGIPRWTTVGNHNERNLSLSARIRSVFNTHTKV